MFCSVIIPTIGRDTVARAVNSALAQPLPCEAFEVIVVNDSGQPLQPAAWQQSPQVTVITTNKRERCVARNTAAAVAKGDYLYFLDDDDWLLPHALATFQQLALDHPQAAWLYGGLEIVDQAGKLLGEANSGLSGNCCAQVMGGAWVPIQTSLIRSDFFFSVGGYNPHIIGTEDQDLCRRIAIQGDFANTPEVVACLFRGEGWQTSTIYARAPEDTRLSRDLVAEEPHAFKRLIASAATPYWYGRIFRIYTSLALWHLQHKRLFIALSRTLYAIAIFFSAGGGSLTWPFWEGVRAHHVPGTLHFIEKKLQETPRY